MKHIDGKKVEIVVREVYDIFVKHDITGNEGSAIAGMILTNAASRTATELLEKSIIQK